MWFLHIRLWFLHLNLSRSYPCTRHASSLRLCKQDSALACPATSPPQESIWVPALSASRSHHEAVPGRICKSAAQRSATPIILRFFSHMFYQLFNLHQGSSSPSGGLCRLSLSISCSSDLTDFSTYSEQILSSLPHTLAENDGLFFLHIP